MLELNESEWPKLIPKDGQFRNFQLRWKFGSAVVVSSVAILSKLWLELFNSTRVYNHQQYLNSLEQNFKRRENPLITICNHSSCLDDPLIPSTLMPWTWNLNSKRHRFSGAAHNICFTNRLYTLFFSLGKTVPVYRGAGIYQPSINFLLELVKANQFIYVFPQGKVIKENYQEETERMKSDNNFHYKQLDLRDEQDKHINYAFKWGLARIILDTLSSSPKKIIELLPIYHIGLDKVVPNIEPYIPRMNKKVTIFIREDGPLRITNELVRKLCFGLSSPSEKRAELMNFLEDEMKKIKFEALKKHFLTD